MGPKPVWNIVLADGENFQLRRSLSTEEVIQGLRARAISWGDFAYIQGKLRRLLELQELKEALNPLPGREYIKDLEYHLQSGAAESSERSVVKAAAPRGQRPLEPGRGPGDTFWFLQFEGTEFGPVSITELQTVVQTGKIKGAMYAWRKGMENWVPVSSLSELSHLFEGKPKGLPPRPPSRFSAAKPEVENRTGDRFSLVATTWWIKDGRSREILGICSDVSPTGMQVILDVDHVFDKGDTLKVEVLPVGASGVGKFQTDGKVMWSLPDERRIGIQFTTLAPNDRASLERYLAQIRARA